MKAISSWSGGKDCSLALYRAQQQGHEVILFTVTSHEGPSRSHRLTEDTFTKQAEALGVRWHHAAAEWGTYEKVFKNSLTTLKENYGLEGMIFGDIELDEHREWGERICRDLDLEAVFPLWRNGQDELLDEFLQLGFTARIVTVKCEVLPAEWTGRRLDRGLIAEIRDRGLSPAGENGEYHTLVTGGPIFDTDLNIAGNGFLKNPEGTHAFWNYRLTKS